WNELQKFCVDNTDNNIIVVANTGMGKTEAGLLWIGDNKGFFILPLRTAINAIYKRISENIVSENIEERVALMHSEVLSYYLEQSVTEEEKVLEYIGKGKNLSMPLSISTLDQIFDFVYLYEGFEVKLSTLSYSKIVIDEIQAYSPYLLAYLVVGLKKITDVGGKFAILTATLPPFVKDCIEKEIGQIRYEKFTAGRDRHNIQVYKEKISSEKIYKHYIENRGKILVVCNTVKKSQEIYRDLKEMGIEQDKINLLHSKFIKKDRLCKEEKIVKFGKTENKEEGIWISTSLVEASLDIDFDYLFTELNDLNGFFQRLGRVNRKGSKSYQLNGNLKIVEISSSPKLDFPNVYIYTEIEKNLLISKNGNTGFIDETIHSLSKEAVLNMDGILSEDKKVELIETYLTSENIADSYFIQEYRKMKNYIFSLTVGEVNKDEVRKKFRDITSYTVIPLAIYENERKKIEELRDIIIDKQYNRIQKAKAQHELEQFTISVGIYDLNRTGE
ncbi:MAG: CRISPR-associated helicase Cas3', partial [Fusobacteriaceae bacterium]